MDYAVMDTKNFEGRCKPVAQTLGTAAIRANQFDSQPDQAGHAHNELSSGQEELYVPLRGTGRLMIDGETVELEPGRYVLVGPAAQRQVIAGPEGLSYLVVGARVAGEESGEEG